MSDRKQDDRLFEELQELVAIEVQDSLAMASEEGFAPRDIVSVLEMELQAEIEALAGGIDETSPPGDETGDIA